MRRRIHVLVGVLTVTTVVVAFPPSARAEVLGGAPANAGAAPPLTSPEQGAPEEFDELQYGDPSAGIDLVDEPVTDGYGSAQLRHPIDLPLGRLGWQPQIQLAYDSSGENDWLGEGWDVSLDAIKVPGLGSDVSADSIEVDSRWGVPRYLDDTESETYMFGGEQLAPNAHRGPGQPLMPREPERIFTKRVEGDFLRIVRHGDDPSNYWWEVHDKLGNKYFYGGVLDDVEDEYTGNGHQVEDAVLKTPGPDGNAYWWGLTEKWDISSNVVTYYYDKVQGDTGVTDGDGDPQAGAPKGTELYLERINYTGSRLRSEWIPEGGHALPRYGPYDVTFVRDSQLDEPRRPDASIDASRGGLDITADLLRKIKITYTPKGSAAAQTVRTYELDYEVGPFEKSLLASITKTDANGQPLSTNRFDYYDDVRQDGDYRGFDPATEHWRTAGDLTDDGLSSEFLGVHSGSALGSTDSIGGGGRLFLGGSLFSPDKLLAVGGGVQLGGGDSENDVEFIDINGDNLPDKVWHRTDCDGLGASVCYRLNTARPDESTRDLHFGAIQGIDTLSHLSEGTEFSVGAGPEAYVGGSIMYNHTWSFSRQTSYFTDVNADGLPDLVRDGDVLFNHLTSSGDVYFDKNSGTTEVPIEQDNKLSESIVPTYPEIAAEQAEELPRLDTVRRWVAPAEGNIEITAPVRLTEPSDIPERDGVRVAIQHNATELWTANIAADDGSEHVPAGVDSLHVERGDRIYFRIGSRNDGEGDRVSWDPTITYVDRSPSLDVNGKDVFTYQGSEDFTLAGLNGAVIAMPYDGRVKVSGDLVKTAETSDDIHVELVHNGVVIKEMCVRGSADGPKQDDCDVLSSDPATGTFPFDAEFDVTGRHENAAGDLVPGDKISLRLAVDSNIDPNAVKWAPELRYLSATDENGNPMPVVDNDGDPTMILKAPYDVDLYPNTNVAMPQGKDNEQSVVFRFEVDRDDIPDTSLPAEMTFTAKTDDGVLRFKHTFTIPAGDGIYRYPEGPCHPVSGDCPKDDFDWDGHTASLDTFYDFTFRDGAVARATDFFFTSDVPIAKWWPGIRVEDDAADVFPPPYRGWGYAGYNADGQRAIHPINEEDLVIRQEDLPDPEQPPTSSDDPDFNNPVKGASYPFGPLPANGLWIGPKFDDSNPSADPLDQQPCAWPFTDCLVPRGTWGGPDQASSSVLAGEQIGALRPDQIITGDASAPAIYGKADADSLNADIVGLGGGFSTGKSDGVVDFMDMNGDGYPDVVSAEGVVYTNQNGGFGETEDPGLDNVVRYNHEYATQAGAGGSPASISTGSDGKGAGASGVGDGGGAGGSQEVGKNGKSKKKKAGKLLTNLAKSLGLGGMLAQQATNSRTGPQLDCGSQGGDCNTQLDLVDLNGDGLPDRVRSTRGGDIHVRWNLGYRFTDEWAHWADATLDEGSTTSTSLDIGLGFGTGLLDFSGGVSLSNDDERTDVTWADVSGDGLDDLLVAHVDPVTGVSSEVDVQLNTGTGLTKIQEGDPNEGQFGAFLNDHVSRSKCTGIGGGGDFTVGIPIFKIYYILINPGFSVDKGSCAPTNDLIDVNGDGNLDSVSSSHDGDLDVALNTTGRTNLLKTVHRPLGARIDLDYQRAGNTTAHPASQYVLSRVVVDDGHPGDGADKQVTTYRFEGARESFAEREDYGFHKMIEEERDPATDEVYRSWERIYHNATYYQRGLLQSETLRDGAGTAVTSTEMSYRMVDSTTGEIADLTSLTGSIFPALTRVVNTWHDDAGNPAKTTQMDYAYDDRGNLVTVTDLGEPGTDSDDVTAEMTYPDCSEDGGNYSKEYPNTQAPANSLIVRSGSTILQRRESEVGCDTASVSEVSDYLDPTSGDADKIAVTYVCYLPVGGQTSAVIGPSKTGETLSEPCDDYGAPQPGPDTYTVTYGYADPDELGSYVTTTSDSHGLTTTSTYDNRFGRLVSTTDPVGAKTSYAYDVANRLTSVTGPLEQGTGKQTITYEYHPTASVPWAKAKHIDPANPGTTIDTASFIDGLQRQIETKRDVSVFTGANSAASDRMVVEDQVWFDAFDRPVKEFYAITEPLGTAGVFNASTDNAHVTQTDYDVLDRETRISEPGQRVTEVDYGFDTGPFAAPMFSVLEDPPGPARSRDYQDVRQNTVGTELLHTVNGTEQPLFTRYDYDPLQRLTKIVAPGERTTTATYDLLGRRTSIDNPDTGLTEFGYDLASNVISETTPNLRADGKEISYDYEFNRLTEVSYPNNPQNDVTYTYGEPGAPEHGAGQLVRVDDGARTETIGYDLLGNAVRTTDVMKVSRLSPANIAAHTFTTRYQFDTWGRELQMTYPDGEQLTTAYDSGGLAKSITGRKGAGTYPYVKRYEYDRFGNHRYMEYGNGVTTETAYDANTLWFTDQVVKKGTSIHSDLHYKYDAAGNVVQRNDTRPVPTYTNDLGGVSSQTFAYDDLDRLVSASGTYTGASRQTRTFTTATTFDATGRVARKTQMDKFVARRDPEEATTFDSVYDYGATQPHAATQIGTRSQTWDLNGNLTSWEVEHLPTRRTVTWDEEDRMTSVTDVPDPSTTHYKYDFEDELSIRSGPPGETEFVNDEYTVLNGVAWKNMFINDQLVAVNRVVNPRDPIPYYVTNDLTESSYLVTNFLGRLVEHTLFFPGGEFWVRETETEPAIRERHVFAGSYLDQTRRLYNMGDRWYEPRQGFFYSADPVLVGDLEETVDYPALLNAFSYAEDNPTSFVDPTGDQRISAQLSHRAETFASQAEVAAARAYLGAYRSYNSPAAKAFRDKYIHRVFMAKPSEASQKRIDRANRALGFLAGPPLFELSLAENGSFTLAETDFKIAGVGFRDVRKLIRKLRR